MIGLDDEQQQVYYWRSEPGKDNLDGATDRPVPQVAIRNVLRSLFALERSNSELSLDTSVESSFEDFDSIEEETVSEPETGSSGSHECTTCDNPKSKPNLLEEAVQKAIADPVFAEQLIGELGKNATHRKLFHRIRKSYRRNHPKKSSKPSKKKSSVKTHSKLSPKK